MKKDKFAYLFYDIPEDTFKEETEFIDDFFENKEYLCTYHGYLTDAEYLRKYYGLVTH